MMSSAKEVTYRKNVKPQIDGLNEEDPSEKQGIVADRITLTPQCMKRPIHPRGRQRATNRSRMHNL